MNFEDDDFRKLFNLRIERDSSKQILFDLGNSIFYTARSWPFCIIYHKYRSKALERENSASEKKVQKWLVTSIGMQLSNQY